MANLYRNYLAFTVVNSGQRVSEPFIDIEGLKDVAVWSPTVTSCQIFFLSSFDQTSANFVRVGDSETTISHLEWNVEVGSRAIAIIDHIGPFPFLKLELSVAQTDVRTFAIIAKRIS